VVDERRARQGLTALLALGFTPLPSIIWRKPTNAPTKFMGSGMLPNGAYVTLEHEFILIFRKGGKRRFSAEDNERRYESAYFWEERNEWFSDLWTIVGSKQRMKSGSSRERSAAYPMELAYRLVNMFSIKGDTVLDPFLGMGSTALACVASGRNSVGYEIDGDIVPSVIERMMGFKDEGNEFVKGRLRKHAEFIAQREGKMAHENDFRPVVEKIPDGGEGLDYALVVGNVALIIEGNVEIAPDDHPLPLHLDILHGFYCHDDPPLTKESECKDRKQESVVRMF